MVYHLDVKKIFVILILALFLLSSCATGRKTNAGDEVDSVEVEAVSVLGRDMMSAVTAGTLSTSDIEPALSVNYTSYSKYLPSYKEIETRYLEKVLSLFEPDFVNIFKDTVNSALDELSSSPEKYLAGDMLTPDLKTKADSSLREKFSSLIESSSSEMKEAYRESGESFSMVKKAYDNLYIIGDDENLGSPEEIERESLITLVLEKYFSVIEKEELSLRTNPLYGESTYRLFWEEHR